MGVKLLSVYSELSDYSSLSWIVQRVSGLLGLQAERPASNEEQAVRASEGSHVIALVLTGGTEAILRAIKESSRSAVLVYHGSYNSLPAALEASSETGLMLVGVEEAGRLKAYIRAAQATERIRGSTATFLGRPSPWLVHSGNPELLSRIGMSYRIVELDELMKRYEAQDVPEQEAVAVASRAPLAGVGVGDVRQAMRVERAIRGTLSGSGSTCFSIRCFDIIHRASTTACLALSRLNDEGYTAGCEGDVSAMATMKVLREISGRPSFMGNVVSATANELVIAHCTAPTSMLKSFSLTTHFESGKGVGVRGEFEPGQEFTLARLDLASGVLRAGVGVSQERAWRGDICRTQLTLALPGASLVIERPIGNHYVAVAGDYLEELKMYAYINGLRFEGINGPKPASNP